GPDSAPSVEVLLPAAPEAPGTGCPEGWQEVAVGSVRACSAFGGGGPVACNGAEAHFPGEPGCVQVGTPCPSDAFPPTELLPADRQLRYVLEEASGGDGSRNAPFGTVSEALEGAPPGTTIVVAAGTYAEALVIPTEVQVLGVCAEGTR